MGLVVACVYISWKRQEGVLDIEDGKEVVKAMAAKKILKISNYMSVCWVWGGEVERPHILGAEQAREVGGGIGT